MSTSAGIPDFRSPKTGRSSHISPEVERNLTRCLRAVCCMGGANRVVCKWDQGVPRPPYSQDAEHPHSIRTVQANLAKLKLDRPEDVFDIRFFRSNPYPFYALAKELYPGKHRPTITHSFVRLLETKGLLGTCFTQNIDTLERRAGISKEKVVEAHGSFASQSCIDCKTPFDAAEIRRLIQEGRIPRCNRCRGLVKPDIVFFGESVSMLLPSVPPHFVS